MVVYRWVYPSPSLHYQQQRQPMIRRGGKAVDAHVRELIALHPEELGHIRAAGPIARMEIARRIRALQTKWCSSASRPPVVPIPPPPPGTYKMIEECCLAVEAWPPSLN